MIDLHTHILPAVDDGPESFEESIEILKQLEAQGVTEVFLTPHYIEGTIYDSPRSDNLKLLLELKKAAKEENLNIKLHIGNEITIAPNAPKLLKTKVLSTLSDSKYILVELPISGQTDNSKGVFQELISDGYTIILAHPERYISIQKDFSILDSLKELGVLFQANLGSILGNYGNRAKKTVKKMAKRDLIFGFGTDIYRLSDYDEVTLALAKLAKIYGKAKLDILLNDNPLKILK